MFLHVLALPPVTNYRLCLPVPFSRRRKSLMIDALLIAFSILKYSKS